MLKSEIKISLKGQKYKTTKIKAHSLVYINIKLNSHTFKTVIHLASRKINRPFFCFSQYSWKMQKVALSGSFVETPEKSRLKNEIGFRNLN